MTWQLAVDIATILGLVGSILGFSIKQAREKGTQEAEMKEMKNTVAAHSVAIAKHTGQLAEGEGNFRVTDNKLDNIVHKLDKTYNLIFNHVTGGKP